MLFIKTKPVENESLNAHLSELRHVEVYQSAEWLSQLVALVRPKFGEPLDVAIDNMTELLAALRSTPEIRQQFQTYVQHFIVHRNQVRLFSESGVSVKANFFAEAVQRIGDKILPELHNPSELADLLDIVFPEKTDYRWVKLIPNNLWHELWSMLDFPVKSDAFLPEMFQTGIVNSILILSHRISALGLEPEILERSPRTEENGSPFITIAIEVGNYVELYLKRRETAVESSALEAQYTRAMQSIANCIERLHEVRENQKESGVSVRLVYLFLRLRRAMDRLNLLLRLISPFESSFGRRPALGASLFKELVRAKNLKHDLGEHFSESVGLLAYKIVEHTSATGEKYIASTRREYWSFLGAAAGGGFIVAFTNWVKFLISYLKAAPLVDGLFYSLNYATTFVVLHIFHFTLATKQPAMTASALAKSLDAKDGGLDIDETVSLITKISQSQFASFLGNLAIVFPMSFALSWLCYWITGNHIATEDQAFTTIASLHPFKTLTWFYAGLAGVMLYVASVISGYYDNLILSSHIHLRVKEHPLLRRVISKRALEKFASYIEHNLGALMGNIVLGFLLGMLPVVGKITGLPIDIRHVTIAAGGFAISAAQIWEYLSIDDVAVVLLGIFGVGFFNFLVSFGLALTLAMSSRRATFTDVKSLLRKVLYQFTRRPLRFFFPRKQMA
jgi:site-specific recombinase